MAGYGEVMPSSEGLSSEEVKERLARYGYNEIPEKKESPLVIFIKKFWGITPWMLEATIILTWLLGKYFDAAMVAFLLVFNSALGFTQESRANAALEFLKRQLAVNARVKRDRKWSSIPSRDLVPGDLVRLRAGDFVPADVKIIEGKADADQSSLTGESFIVPKGPGEVLYSGTILRRGEATGIVSATGRHTYFGRTVELVQIAKPRLRMEEVTSKVVWWLLLMIAALLAMGAAISMLKGQNIIAIIPLAVILLISAIPIALPTMFIISMALGSVELAKMGVLTTRLNAIENAATMDVLCVDKTGTITQNRLYVADVLPMGGYRADDVILYGALASREANQDPIDIAFLSAAKDREISQGGYNRVKYTPFDPTTRRTSAVIENAGQSFVVTKGALNSIIPGCINCSMGLTPEMVEAEKSMTEKGYRAIAVARGGSLKTLDLAGIVFLYDKPRPDSASLIKELLGLGIDVKMLTGDALPIARELAKEVGLGPDVTSFAGLKGKSDKKATEAIEKSGGFAEVYPADKFFIVESLQRSGHIVGMTGDGVNDSPALKQADVGIAVSSAVDVAKKAAGIVLTREGLSGIVDLIVNGRRIYRRVNTWVFNKIIKTFQAIVFVILAFILTGQFVISIFGMILFLFLSDFVTLSISTDNVTYSNEPDRWDIAGLVKVAAPLGLLTVAESFILLYIGFHYFGFSGTEGLYTYVFDILMFMALFGVLIVRERGHFWGSMPSRFLLASIALDVLLVAVISVIGLPGLAPISYTAVLAVLAFSAIATFAVNDAIKVLLIKILWKKEGK